MITMVLATLVALQSPAVPPSGGGATHVLIITGLSAEPRFATEFAAAAAAIDDAARKQWHVADSSITYLSEDPAVDRSRMTGKATREQIGAAFARLATRVRAGDLVLVMLIGHGGGEMATSALNVPGPDPTVTDYASWLDALGPATVVFVNAATGSGDFTRYLAAPNRVVITATKTGLERNESIFAGIFATGLTGVEADADKDGKVSVAEAFMYAKTQVAKQYDATKRLLTEHAVLADTSGIAAGIAFGGDAASSDPRVTALVGERRILEASVDSLRRLKSTTDSTTYSRELERLLLLIATKTQAIRALQPGGQP
jgi:hypothetical protein